MGSHFTMVWNNTIKYMLDIVLDGCIIYKLLLVLTQRDALYQNNILLTYVSLTIVSCRQ